MIPSFAVIKRWIALIVLGLLVATIGVQTLRLANARLEVAHLQQAKAIEDKTRADLRAKQVADAAAREQAMVAAGAEQGRKDAEQIARLDADRDRLDGLLRNRPRRPGPGAVPSPAAPAGCSCASPGGATGAQLYAEDGEFLAREAARADRAVIQLQSCLAQFEAGRKQLSGIGK